MIVSGTITVTLYLIVALHLYGMFGGKPWTYMLWPADGLDKMMDGWDWLLDLELKQKEKEVYADAVDIGYLESDLEDARRDLSDMRARLNTAHAAHCAAVSLNNVLQNRLEALEGRHAHEAGRAEHYKQVYLDQCSKTDSIQQKYQKALQCLDIYSTRFESEDEWAAELERLCQ